MNCKNCGKTLDDKARFCPDCGTEVDPMDVIESLQAQLMEGEPTAMPENEPELTEPADIPEETASLLSDLNDTLNSGADEPETLPEPDPVPADDEEKSTEPAPYTAPPVQSKPEPMPYIAPPPVNEQPAPTPYIAPPPAYPQQPYPPYDEPEPEQSAEPEQEEKPVKVGALRLTGAFIVSVFAAVFLIALSLLFCLKLGASGDILRRRIEGISMSTILDGSFDNNTVSDNIYNNIHFDEATNNHVDRHAFREFLGNIDLNDFIADKVADYADYIIAGKGRKDPSVTVNEIVDFLQENNDASAEAFDYAMKTADYNYLRSRMEDTGIETVLSINHWSDLLHFRLPMVHYLFSMIALGIILALVIVLLIWIAVIVDRKGRHIMSFYGNIFCWSGGIMLLIGICASAGTAVAHVVTGNIICFAASSVLLPFALFAVCTGAFEMVLGVIFRKIRKAIRNKDKRLKAVEKALEANSL